MRARLVTGTVVVALPLLVWSSRLGATVEMQNAAKALGFPIKNCIDCHASPHAAEKMKEKARELNIADGNCLLCHGANIPAALNDRGRWLVDEKERRGADEADMAWLKDYKEPPAEENDEPDAPKE